MRCSPVIALFSLLTSLALAERAEPPPIPDREERHAILIDGKADPRHRESPTYAQARAATDAYDSQIAGIVLGAAAEIGTMAAAGSSSVPASTAPIDTTTSSLRGGFRSTAPYTGYTGHAGMVGEY